MDRSQPLSPSKGLSKRSVAVLAAMRNAELENDFEGSEIVVDGRATYLGLESIPRRVVSELLCVLAITDRSDGGALTRYSLNGLGRDLCDNPSLATQVRAAIAGGTAFTIESGKLRILENEAWRL